MCGNTRSSGSTSSRTNCVDPVELLLVLRIGFEVPRHVQPSLGRDSEYDSDYQERNTNLSGRASGPGDVAGRIVRRTPVQAGGPVRQRGPSAAGCRRSRSSAAAARRRGPGWPTSSPRPGSPTTPSTATSARRTPWSRPSSRTGASACSSYLAHQMAKEPTPEGQVRRWVRGVLAQADKDIAATTLAVLWNASTLGGGPAAGRHFASAPVSSLLREPVHRPGQHGAGARRGSGRARDARPALGLPLAADRSRPGAEVERVDNVLPAGRDGLTLRPRRTPRGPSSVPASP